MSAQQTNVVPRLESISIFATPLSWLWDYFISEGYYAKEGELT